MDNKQRLIDANLMREDWLENGENEYIYDTNAVLASIDEQPTVDAVEVVHCEWIRCLDVDDVEYIECPICGGEFYDGDNDTFDKPYNYCPICGAKMDGGN